MKYLRIMLFVVRRALFLVLLAAVIFCVWLVSSPRPSRLGDVAFSRMYVDRNGAPLQITLTPDDKYRLYTPLSSMNPRMIEATLLYEDRYFWHHGGVNPYSLLRALGNLVTGGGRRMGASTITMQVVRMHDRLNTRTWTGKIQQIMGAFQWEWHYSKDEILEAYFNLAPYGGNVEGIGAASRVYFHKDPADLLLVECLTLSVIPQNPQKRAPWITRQSERVLEARQRLFEKWTSLHPEDLETQADMETIPLFFCPRDLPHIAPHFITGLEETTGNGSSKVVTTIDLSRQQQMERVLQEYLDLHQAQGVNNAAVLLIDAPTREVVACVGSAGFMNQKILGQNDGTRMYRSPGSALKPFIYAMALEQGLIHPGSLLKDSPASFGGYTPENFDRSFAGPIHATDALIQSRNVPAVYLESRLGPRNLITLLGQVGVRHLRPKKEYGLAAALGATEVSMEDLGGLYAMLANHGQWGELVKVLTEEQMIPIRNRNERHAPQAEANDLHKSGTKLNKDISGVRSLLTPEASVLTLQMLAKAPRPGEIHAAGLGKNRVPVAWKTGTSFGFKDAWTAGVFGRYVLVVWVGNFDGTPNPFLVGRVAAAPLFFRMADALTLNDKKAESPDFLSNEGLNLTTVELCRDSGDIACPNCSEKISCAYIPGVSPLTRCHVHRPVTVYDGTGEISRDPAGTPGTHQEVREFWPSDIRELFRRAGLERPSGDSSVAGNDSTNEEEAPVITSPRKKVTYHLPLSESGRRTLPLQAVTSATAGTLNWYDGNEHLGSVPAGEPLDWVLTPGEHTLTVVDSSGHSDSRTVSVQAE